MLQLLNTSLNVLVGPQSEVDNIVNRRRNSLIPFVMLLVIFGLLWAKYYQNVDFDWLKDKMIDDAMIKNAHISRDAMEENMASLSADMMLWMNLFSGTIAIMVLLFIRSLYMSVATNWVRKSKLNITHWFAISSWSTLPTTIMMFITLFYFSEQDLRRLPIESVNLGSLNNLFFHYGADNPWATFLNSLDITLLWSLLIIALMFSKASEVPLGKSLFVTYFPFLVIYGVWAGVIVL
jgi:hypothetical protein